MNCCEFKKNINAMIDGNTGGSLKDEMERHMETCSGCREEYERLIAMVHGLKVDAASINLTGKQKKEIREAILKLPVKKSRNSLEVLKALTCAAAIFAFVAAGIYMTGGFKINIGPASGRNSEMQAEVYRLGQENSTLKDESANLKLENSQLKEDNEKLKGLITETETKEKLEKEIQNLMKSSGSDWLICNPAIGEAIIEGSIASVDRTGKKIRLNLYRDDDTPDIDPDIYIPDYIYITKPDEKAGGKYIMKSGSVKDLKAGDHIIIHYIGKIKSARAIIYIE